LLGGHQVDISQFHESSRMESKCLSPRDIRNRVPAGDDSGRVELAGPADGIGNCSKSVDSYLNPLSWTADGLLTQECQSSLDDTDEK
jgi:hypothetical protein